MFFKRKEHSGRTAKKRLLTVVSRDRANVTAEFMLKLSTELIAAATKYVETDYESVSVTIERDLGGVVLQARVPIRGYRPVSA